MLELTCQFTPVVYAELYRLLRQDERLADAVSERLGEIHYDMGWLDEASEAYEAKWVHDLTYLTPDTLTDYALEQPDHAVLATWVLAGLRSTGECYKLSGELGERVLERSLTDVPGLKTPLPSVLSPVIRGWTLGSVLGADDLPAVPAVLPDEENVQRAFLGFVQHVLQLQAMPSPWPEMMATATYWRGYGIAEGLLPEHGNGGRALEQLKNEAHRLMPPTRYTQMHQYFQSFNQYRQAVSHIAVDASRPAFVEVADRTQDWTDLHMAVVGLTQFVFQEVSKELQSTPPASIRPGIWDRLSYEVRAEW